MTKDDITKKLEELANEAGGAELFPFILLSLLNDNEDLKKQLAGVSEENKELAEQLGDKLTTILEDNDGLKKQIAEVSEENEKLAKQLDGKLTTILKDNEGLKERLAGVSEENKELVKQLGDKLTTILEGNEAIYSFMRVSISDKVTTILEGNEGLKEQLAKVSEENKELVKQLGGKLTTVETAINDIRSEVKKSWWRKIFRK